ncbi:MAG: DNA polymerase III subunit delta' [Cytophagales bacterium]|nr:DNA polymerase III subunit delta' [Cytophagales bacterium]
MTNLLPWLERDLVRLLAQRGHAYLVTGTLGLGQFELAMAMAASLLCEANQQQACGHCDACHMVRAKSHPDLAVLLPETLSLALGWPLDEKTQTELDDKKRKPSKQIKLEAVQDLISFVQRTSSRGKGLVAVIYPAEAMNPIAANALLKSLEEPVGNTRFVLATEDSAALLPTIRSRCQSFVLTPPEPKLVVAWMASEGVSEKDANVWLKAAGGQPQTALAMSQSIGQTSVWQDFPKLIAKGALPSDLPAALVETPTALVGALQKLCHDAMCVSQGSEPRFFESVASTASHSSLYQLTTWAKALNVHARSSEHTLNAGLMIEALLAEAKLALASQGSAPSRGC